MTANDNGYVNEGRKQGWHKERPGLPVMGESEERMSVDRREARMTE